MQILKKKINNNLNYAWIFLWKCLFFRNFIQPRASSNILLIWIWKYINSEYQTLVRYELFKIFPFAFPLWKVSVWICSLKCFSCLHFSCHFRYLSSSSAITVVLLKRTDLRSLRNSLLFSYISVMFDPLLWLVRVKDTTSTTASE